MAVLKYLFGFEGRINRAKMWGYYLIAAAMQLLLIGLNGVSGAGFSTAGSEVWLDDDASPFVVAIVVIVSLLIAWSFLAVMVKRLHDRDRSGWWLPVFFVLPVLPILAIAAALQSMGFDLNGTLPTALLIAGFVVAGGFQMWGWLELYIARGTHGPNRFGPDPLDRSD